MGTALAMPGVKVDRDDFLKKELCNYCSQEQIEQAISTRPIDIVPKEILDKIANACINSHTTKVTAISAAAGIPGGIAMAATIPADIAQYYWHVFVLSQKLAYLYGFPDLRDENGNLTDTSSDILTLFVGVMMGAAAANQAIKEISKEFAKQVIKRLPQKALTKTIYYPIIKQIAKWIGIKLTKDSFAKGVGKAIPILGGIISGGLTYATFRPCAKRLQHKLQENTVLLKEGNNKKINEEEDFYQSETFYEYEDIAQDSKDETTINSKDKTVLMILINMAKIDHNITDAKIDFINDEIEHSTLTEDEQLELATSYNTTDLFQIDFNVIRNDDQCIIQLLKKIILLTRIDGKITLAEKIYLKKIAREVGYSPEDLEELLNNM